MDNNLINKLSKNKREEFLKKMKDIEFFLLKGLLTGNFLAIAFLIFLYYLFIPLYSIAFGFSGLFFIKNLFLKIFSFSAGVIIGCILGKIFCLIIWLKKRNEIYKQYFEVVIRK